VRFSRRPASREQPPSSGAVLEVVHLSTDFATAEGRLYAVRDVSLTVRDGETVGVVGESGSGKSVTMLTVMDLLPGGSRTHVSGAALFNGLDLRSLSHKDISNVRGKDIAMVFQDPTTCLNPVLTIGHQLMEPLRRHLGMTARQASARAIELLTMVDIAAPEQQLGRYPHQFSGGMRQRLMLAMALSCEPQLLIADEPTTSLDVTVQASIVALVKRLRTELGMAIIWVTHDLSLLAGLADHVIVMYAGRVIEDADVQELFHAPRHPYTMGLLANSTVPRSRLTSIEGMPPSLLDDRPGCSFAPRCPFAQEKCWTATPELIEVSPEHFAACWVLPDSKW
jgi:oligopeptide transport system ATP-binding protein